jgi:hypothetical protein
MDDIMELRNQLMKEIEEEKKQKELRGNAPTDEEIRAAQKSAANAAKSRQLKEQKQLEKLAKLQAETDAAGREKDAKKVVTGPILSTFGEKAQEAMKGETAPAKVVKVRARTPLEDEDYEGSRAYSRGDRGRSTGSFTTSNGATSRRTANKPLTDGDRWEMSRDYSSAAAPRPSSPRSSSPRGKTDEEWSSATEKTEEKDRGLNNWSEWTEERVRGRSSQSNLNRVDTSGVTLQQMLEYLVDEYGFEWLFKETNIRCFSDRPSISSSLKGLRQPQMEWARKKVEYLYIQAKK